MSRQKLLFDRWTTQHPSNKTVTSRDLSRVQYSEPKTWPLSLYTVSRWDCQPCRLKVQATQLGLWFFLFLHFLETPRRMFRWLQFVWKWMRLFLVHRTWMCRKDCIKTNAVTLFWSLQKPFICFSTKFSLHSCLPPPVWLVLSKKNKVFLNRLCLACLMNHYCRVSTDCITYFHGQ